VLSRRRCPDGHRPRRPRRSQLLASNLSRKRTRDCGWTCPGRQAATYRDMAHSTAELTDERVRGDLSAALEGKGAFRRFQEALNRHETYRVHWRCSPPSAAPEGPEPGWPTRATTPSPDPVGYV
jgi:hypothetical protein